MHDTQNSQIQNALPDLVEHVPAVVFRLSHTGENWHTWYVTRNIDVYGYQAEDFISGAISWLDIVHPDDRVLLNTTINDYEAHHINSFKLYYRLLTRDGESVPVTEYNTVNRDAEGRILCYDTCIVSNTQDEASRRLIDAHYRQQVVLNDILMSLHDSNPDHALQIILDRTGAYLDTSRALLFKDSPDHKTCKIVYEWCNSDITSVMALDNSIDYETEMPEIYVALRNTGILLIDYGEIPENCRKEFEMEGLIASAIFAVYVEGDHFGFVCFDDCIVHRTWDDDTARFLKNIANLISTVLARRRTAEKLEQSRKSYEAVLNNVDSYIFVTEPGTKRILFANRSFRTAFEEQCEGKSAELYLPPNALPSPGLDDAGEQAATEYPEFYCGRTAQWLAVSVEKIRWVDGGTALLYNFYDVTSKKLFADTLERKIEERTRELLLMTEKAQSARDRAEEAMLAKSRFLANMSHEMLTPMNAILGLSELLSKGDLSPTQREHARNIRISSSTLLDLINNILDIAKLDEGNLSLLNANFSLGSMLDPLVEQAGEEASKKSIGFEYTTDATVPDSLCGDADRLGQVLGNLLKNALKFTEKGTVRFAVEADGKHILFKVRDTGTGIRPKDIDSIFKAFSQTDIHFDRKLQGAGLGLPICRSLVELMGGSISVDSVYGEGSLFTVAIPIVREDCDPAPTAEPAEKKLRMPEAAVLVVDDIDVNLYVAEALLEQYDLRIELAGSGAEALKKIRENHFDLVFMDHMMPGMNGSETARAIRQLGGKFASLPIVMLTANVVAENWEEYMREGMDDFLAKPIEPEKLEALLDKWIPENKKIRM